MTVREYLGMEGEERKIQELIDDAKNRFRLNIDERKENYIYQNKVKKHQVV